MEVVRSATLVEKMRETVILIVIARTITNVGLTIVEVLLALKHFMIVATVQKKIFAHLKILVETIKVIVILILSV